MDPDSSSLLDRRRGRRPSIELESGEELLLRAGSQLVSASDDLVSQSRPAAMSSRDLGAGSPSGMPPSQGQIESGEESRS